MMFSANFSMTRFLTHSANGNFQRKLNQRNLIHTLTLPISFTLCHSHSRSHSGNLIHAHSANLIQALTLPLSFTLSLPILFTLSLCHSHSRSRSATLIHALTPLLSFTLSLCHSHSRSRCQSHSRSLPVSFTLSLPISFTLSLRHSHSRSHSATLIHALTPLLSFTLCWKQAPPGESHPLASLSR